MRSRKHSNLSLEFFGCLQITPKCSFSTVKYMPTISTSAALERALTWIVFRNKQGRNRIRVLTGMGLQSMQQWTGINFIFYYGTTYFQSAGISNAFLITIATNVVNVGATVPGIYLVEKLGRRKLLLGGAAVMCICEFIVGAVGTAIPSTNLSGQRVLIAFVCIYIAAFAATWGPTAWVVTGEIYPLAIRAKAMSLSTASNWFWNCIIGVITPYLVDAVPGSAGLQSKVFFIWGSMCMLCFLFAYFFIMVWLCISKQ